MLIDSSLKMTAFGGLGVPVEGDPQFGADLNTLPQTQSGLFGDSQCSDSFAELWQQRSVLLY